MTRFEIPAKIVVEAADAGEALRKAGYLVKATAAVKGRGYALDLTGPAAEAAPDPGRDRCEGCKRPRHDGEPCSAEANTLVP